MSRTPWARAVVTTVWSSVRALPRMLPSAVRKYQTGWMASKKSTWSTKVLVPAAAVSAPIQPQRWWLRATGAAGGAGSAGVVGVAGVAGVAGAAGASVPPGLG